MRNKYMGADLQARLHGTVIRYRGNPFFCVVDGPDVVLRTLKDDRVYARVPPDDKDLDISSVPLGFVNHSKLKFAVHIRREPVRRYKQGVDPQSMTYTPLSNKHMVGGEIFRDPGFQENTLNQFPDFKQALRSLTAGGWESVALARDIALYINSGTIKVYVTTDEIGFIRLASGSDNNKCSIRKTDVSWVIRSKLGQVGIIAEEGLV
jgi:hypothetical protein